ncbi:hypothetical protein JCM3770_002509 [Rhodotorula araucariae]
MPVLVATGVSSGLGLAALSRFARLVLALDPPGERWRILAASRSAHLSVEQERVNTLFHQHSDRLELEWLPLDLPSSTSVHAFAAQVRLRASAVDSLLLNAAVWTADPTYIHAGSAEWTLEAVVNALAQHLLATLLIPLLAPPAAPGHRSRIIVTTSKLHASVSSVDGFVALLHPPSASSLAAATANTGKSRYAASKALQLVSAAYLASALGPRGVQVVAVSPGFVPTTGLSRAQGALARWAMRNIVAWLPFAVTAEEGAARIARCLPLRPLSSVPPPADALDALFSDASFVPLVYLTLASTAPLPLPESPPRMGGVAQLLVDETGAAGARDEGGSAEDERDGDNEGKGWEVVGRKVLSSQDEWAGIRVWTWSNPHEGASEGADGADPALAEVD